MIVELATSVLYIVMMAILLRRVSDLGKDLREVQTVVDQLVNIAEGVEDYSDSDEEDQDEEFEEEEEPQERSLRPRMVSRTR